MSESPALSPRQLAGKLARQRWKGFTPEGLERLHDSAKKNRPWEHSTGPKSADGKRRSALNSTRHGFTQPLRALGRQRREIARWLDGIDVDKAHQEIKDAIEKATTRKARSLD